MESNTGKLEIPLRIQLAEEMKSIVGKLKQLKLDDPSAPAMVVTEDEKRPLAILLGEVIDPTGNLLS